MDREGFGDLETNLMTVISRIQKVQLQNHWHDTITILLTEFEEKRFVPLDDLLERSDLEEEDV